ALRDQHGRLVSLDGQRGHVVVLAFLDSHCHAACPIEGRELAVAERAVPRAVRLTLLVVSVDPWADTPASATAAARRWGWSRPWRWLLGTRVALQPVWRKYGIEVKRGR